tara:strand:+ start:4367 stop:5485 length:1119 start_codon:yes stop_codon:yes gene_type:complete
MNRSLVILSIIISITFFFSGIYIASYEIFPYNILKNLKNDYLDTQSSNLIYYEDNVESLLNVNNKSSVDKLREKLNLFLWDDNSLPKSLPDNIEFDIKDSRYSDLENLDSIDKLTVTMEPDVKSYSYLFKPLKSNNKLILYHQGHSGDFFNGKNTIQFFLENEYSVLAFSMPLLGLNNQPIIDHPQFGKIKLTSHDQLKFLETDNFTPIGLFLKPPIISLNYIQENHSFDSFNMVGLSGGGWTTMMISAIDARIDQSFSIAGSYPIFLRTEVRNFGDYEQTDPKLYEIANYLDLYTIASYGENRKFIQIFNKFDPCCFDGDSYLAYENVVKNNVLNLKNGYFDIYLDDTHKQHKISEYALGIIINSIENEEI